MQLRRLASTLCLALSCDRGAPDEVRPTGSVAEVVAPASAAPSALPPTSAASASAFEDLGPTPVASRPEEPRYLPDNPRCAVPKGMSTWSWSRLRKVEGLRERAVSITLDVGSKLPTLEKVLDVLHEERARATMFVATAELAASPRGAAIVRRMVADGHEIGNHSVSHVDLTKVDEAEAAAEIDGAEAFVMDAVGVSTKPFFREPFLAANEAVDRLLKGRCYRSVWFTVDTGDWREGVRAGDIVDKVFRGKGRDRSIEPGTILIFHGSQRENLEALPAVIRGLRDRGFALLTLGEALRRAEPPSARADGRNVDVSGGPNARRAKRP